MSYSSEVLADSPLVYWRLGDASGTTATDSSGNSRSGTLSGTLGATSLLPTSADTAMGTAKGTGQRVTIASASWMNVSTITVEAWVKFTSSTNLTSGDAVMSRYNTGGFQFLLFRNTSSKFQIQFVNGSTSLFNVTDSASIVVNNIYHVVATLDGTTARLYVNGVSVGTPVAFTGSLTSTSTQPLEVGRYSQTDSTTPDAVFDEAAVYGTALSAARVAAHYAAGTGAVGGSGSLSLSAAGTATGPGAVTGSGSLSLSGSGVASGAVSAGSGSLSLSGSGAAKGAATGSGSLTLSAAGDTVAPSSATGTGSLTLSGTGAATGSAAASGSGSLTLSGSGSATLADSGTGFLSLTATGTAQVLYVTDTSNLLNGRVRRAYATSTVERPAAATPTRAAVKYDKAVPYPPPTLVDGRVT